VIIRWKRSTKAKLDSTYYDWYVGGTTIPPVNPVVVFKALFSGEPIHWRHRQHVMVGAEYGVDWTAGATPSATTMAYLRATHRRVFSRVFGRVN